MRQFRFVILGAFLALLPFVAHAANEIIDTNTGQKLKVDANRNLAATLPATISQAGFAKLADVQNEGIDGINLDDTGALEIARPTPIFFDPIEGTTLDVRKWNQPVTSMSITQAASAITLNGGAVVTANSVAQLKSWLQFPLTVGPSCQAEWPFKYSGTPAANQVSEMGLMAQPNGTGATTDGAYFQMTNGAAFQAVRTIGSVDMTSAVTLTNPTQVHLARIYRGLRDLQFYLDGSKVATISTAGSAALATSTTQLVPFGVRHMNSATPPATGVQLIVGPVTVSCDGMDDLPRLTRYALMGGGLASAPANNATARTGVQNPNWANSAAPASATLSNTAAGYTTIGGQYQFAASATNETDWALFAWQNPSGNTAFITGIDVSMCATGAAVANATNFFWAVATNSTAVSLATADALSTSALGPRRDSIGSQAFLAAALQGTCANDIVRRFDPPKVVPGGQFLHVIVKQLNGAATASLVFRGHVHVDGVMTP